MHTISRRSLGNGKSLQNPGLCNAYCATECPIGQKYVPAIEAKELPQIVLEMVNSINIVNEQKNRLISIAVDGKLTNDEFYDFAKIENELEKISISVETLQLWLENTIETGDVDETLLNSAREKVRGNI